MNPLQKCRSSETYKLCLHRRIKVRLEGSENLVRVVTRFDTYKFCIAFNKKLFKLYGRRQLKLLYQKCLRSGGAVASSEPMGDVVGGGVVKEVHGVELDM